MLYSLKGAEYLISFILAKEHFSLSEFGMIFRDFIIWISSIMAPCVPDG